MAQRSRARPAAPALAALAAVLGFASPAAAEMELRHADLPDGARLALRLDACATAGPLVQVRESSGAIRLSLGAADLELGCAESGAARSSIDPGVGSWLADWWVDAETRSLVLVPRATGAPQVRSLRSGERRSVDPDVIVARLRDRTLWPREQLRALDLAAAWLPAERLPALRGVVRDARRARVVRLRAAALLNAFGDASGEALVLQFAAPRAEVTGLRPPADLTGADVGELQTRAGSLLRCDRPPPWAQEQPDDPEAARQYAIQLLPGLLDLKSVTRLRALVRTSDPLDRLAVRTALLCLAWRQEPDDPRAEQLERAARWTGGGAGLRTDGPSLRELEASASSPDPYVAAAAIRSLLGRDGGTRSAMLRLLRLGTTHDGLVGLYFASNPDPGAIEALQKALLRHEPKSRSALHLTLALRASVSDDVHDELVAANGISPARWQAWARQEERGRSRVRRPDPWTLLVSALPLMVLLWSSGAIPRRRR